MAATFKWSESNGAGEVVTDEISNLNFGTNDSPNLVTTTYPIVAGNNAYEKYLRLKFGGSFSEISNVKFWKSAGTLKTGEDVKAAANQTYTQPVSTTSVKATVTIPTDVGSALSVQSTEGDPSIFTLAGYSKYLVLQLQTTGLTPAGAVNTKTLTIQYDEI
jgi:hypothetical protein